MYFKLLIIINLVILSNSVKLMIDNANERYYYDHQQENEYKLVNSNNQNHIENEIELENQHDDSVSSTSSVSTAGTDKNVENVIVKVGQQAVLPCFVNNLGSHKVIWAKDGDILALGTTKINSDTRLNIQHRYVSEWHLIIDNVVTDDEGEYICKTNGNFFKVLNLQVSMPPTIDDLNSTPAGAISLKEGASITLKCYADAKPEPVIKWYRWKKYKHLTSEKEELDTTGNEIEIPAVRRNDANMYECIAKNSVPPATSRIFNIEIHFLPSVDMEIRKTFQFLHKKFSLECKINSNPIDKLYWYKNGQIFESPHEHFNRPDRHQERSIKPQDNIRVDKYDISDLDDLYKTLLTLTVVNAKKQDFGEYQCCAVNSYGQICSNIFVQEIKQEMTSTQIPILISTLSLSSVPNQAISSSQISKLNSNLLTSTQSMQLIKSSPIESDNRIITNDEVEESEEEDVEHGEDSAHLESDDLATNGLYDMSKDKRRHYMIKSKQYLQLDRETENSSLNLVSNVFSIILVQVLAMSYLIV